jgi:hypothetical protein
MSSILDGALERGPFAAEGGRTGAAFERATLADGTPVIIKHTSKDDWMLVVSGGVSYLETVWRAGVFERMPSVIDHAMIAFETREDGYTLVMRDVSEHVLAEGRVLTREENVRVLAAVDAMYREFWSEDLPGCSLADHFEVFSPRHLERLGHLQAPIPALMRRGWDMFGDVAPATLMHGDLRLHNLGLSPDRVVLLDWELVGSGPSVVDFGWYLIISASRIAATREEITEDFRTISADHFDPYGLELGMISALISLGWNKAIDIVENPDPAVRAAERADLDWWIARVRRSLETWSAV